MLKTLKEHLSKFNKGDFVFVGGDFNGRVGTEPDFINENETDLKYSPEGYELFKSNRNNHVISLSEYGRQLLSLCISTKLRILNGRTR